MRFLRTAAPGQSLSRQAIVMLGSLYVLIYVVVLRDVLGLYYLATIRPILGTVEQLQNDEMTCVLVSWWQYTYIKY